MSRLMRDGTAEPVLQDQILRRVRGIFIFPVQLTTSRIGNVTRLVHTLLYVMTIHTCRKGKNGEYALHQLLLLNNLALRGVRASNECLSAGGVLLRELWNAFAPYDYILTSAATAV